MTNTVNQIWETKTTQQLAEVFASMTDVATMQDFLRDVMTEKEITEISSRLEAAKMLSEGSKYTDIIEKTRLSSRTVARISDWMQNGSGGYSAALKLIATHYNHIPPVRAE